MDTMKKGIPCFDYNETGKKNQTSIYYSFVSGDEEIPSHFRVSLGDVDPMTGEAITDVTFFQQYHTQRNHEIYLNKKAVAAAPTSSEAKKLRRELRKKLAADFERDNGYPPDKAMLNWLMRNSAPKNYRRMLDAKLQHGEQTLADILPEMADPAAERALCAVEEEKDTSLDRFAETLDGLEKDVFLMLQMEADGVDVRGMGRQLAAKWNRDKSMISKAKLSIGRKLLVWLKETADKDF